MKKIISLILTVCLVSSLIVILPITASAEIEGYYTYEVANDKATITYCDTSISGDVTIPSTLGGYPVTSIGDKAFYWCTSLTSITIPDGVTSIGNSAFSDCYSLTSITIPDSVTSIGSYAFNYCYSLTSITIPDSVTSIGDYTFQWCYGLTSINVADNNQYYSSLDGNLFNKDKTTLIQYAIGKDDTSYIIPDNVTSIGNSAFRDCESLTSITIPDGVTSIGNYTFYNCNSLTSITIPDSVTSIGSYAFNYCSIADVYYGGSEEDWNNISIGVGKTYLTEANIHYDYDKVTFTSEAAFGKADASDKTLRFYFMPSYGEAVTVTNFGAYVVPFALFSEGDVTAGGESMNYSGGKSIDSGKTFSVDLIDIPESAYDKDIVAIPYVVANGNYVYGETTGVKVNDLK